MHRGADGFVSGTQFERSYWPTLKAVMLELIEEGCVPVMFAEGSYDQRLEIIATSRSVCNKHGVNTIREEGWRYVKIAVLS